MKKIIISALVALVIVEGVVIVKLLEKPSVAGTSVAGALFNTAKFAGVSWALTSATSSSVYNSDDSDRMIISVKYSCSGVGTSLTAYTGTPLTSLTLKAATTSTIASSALSVSNTNLPFSSTIATTTATSGFLTFASTTMSVAGGAYFNQVWAAGSYLTFFSNATNTAACTIGVEYLPS